MSIRTTLMLLLFAAAAGCASDSTFEDGKRAFDEGRWEDSLRLLDRAAKEHPGNPQYRSAYIRSRDIAVAQLLADADYAFNAGDFDLAEARAKRVLDLDPGSVRAKNALAQLQAERRHRGQTAIAEKLLAAGDAAGAESAVRQVLAQNPNQREARALARRIAELQAAALAVSVPTLGAAFQKPVTLEFRDANLRSVFEVIARTSGVNFVFDRDVRPDIRVTIFVRDTSIDDVVKLILATNQLERKVLSPNAVLIYPNTPAKAREYVDLITRSFYLGNADPKQTLNLIRTIVKTRDIYIDEKLNLVIMRDTPAAVRLAEKLIAMQDLAEPEVTLELEVLEVSRSKALELGIRFPDRVNFGPLGDGTAGAPAAFAFSRGQLTASVANPAFVLSLRQQEGLANVLANPRIRARNREKARIHIGEKVPVVTTTSTANVGVSASVSYLEVGLKLDVEPNVYLDDEIAIKVALEVSNIIETIDILNTRAYRLGTRNAATTLRLRDGETQVLAGLIQDEDRRAASKVPGLGDLPILGRLFTSNNDQTAKTEIVLLITPRIVRNVVRPESYAAEFFSGTEASAGAPPLRLSSPSGGTIALSSTPSPGIAPAPGFPSLVPGFPSPVPGLFPPPPVAPIGPSPARPPGASPTPPGASPTPPGASPAPPASPVAPGALPPLPGVPKPLGGLVPFQPSAPVATAPAQSLGETSAMPIGLILGAPGQAVLGKEFTLTLGVPPTPNARTLELDLSYDPAQFEVVSPAGGASPTGISVSLREPGRVTVRVENRGDSGGLPAASVQFRAVGKVPVTTQLLVTSMAIQDRSGNSVPVAVPPPHTVNLVPQ